MQTAQKLFAFLLYKRIEKNAGSPAKETI